MTISYRRPWLSLVTCLLILPAFSQIHLTGSVEDVQHHPVPGVSIALCRVGDTLRGLSDDRGAFSITVPQAGYYTMRVTHVSFVPQSLPIGLVRDTSLMLVLQSQTLDLAAVQVTGTRMLVDRRADRTVFNVGASITAAGGDALNTLTKVPGVRAGSDGVSIVGKGLTRVMVNGKLLQLSGDDLLNYLRAIPANELDKIEVITHPSARYEADGNAGLVNIVTRRNTNEGYSGNVQTSYKVANGYNNFGATGNINYNHRNLSLFGNVNFSGWTELEGFIIGIDYPDRTWSLNDTGIYKANNKAFTVGGDYKLSPKASVGFVYNWNYVEYEGNDNVHNPIYAKSTGLADSMLRTYAVYNPVAINQSLNLHYVQALGSGGRQFSLDGDYFNYYRTDYSHFESNVYDGKGNETSTGKTLYYNTAKQNIIVYTLKGDVLLPTKAANFSVGAKLSFINNYSNAFYYRLSGSLSGMDSTKSNEFTYTENTQAAYVNAARKAGRWDLQAGMRVEVEQTKGYSHTLRKTTLQDYLQWFPSLSAVYNHNEDHTFSLTYGKRINRPTFWTLNPYKSLLTAFSYFDGNPSLQPEYTQTAEVSHTYRKWLTTSAYLSHTSNGFDNVTIASVDTNLVYRTPLNFLSTYKYGISESVNISPTPWWQSTNMANVYYTRATSRIAYIANISGWGEYLSTNNSFSFNKDRTIKGAINFWCQFPEVDHIGRSNTYYSLDLGLMVLTLKKKLAIALNATDLTKSGASTVNTRVNGMNMSWENFQLMRSFAASLTYSFGNTNVKGSSRETGNESERKRVN